MRDASKAGSLVQKGMVCSSCVLLCAKVLREALCREENLSKRQQGSAHLILRVAHPILQAQELGGRFPADTWGLSAPGHRGP